MLDYTAISWVIISFLSKLLNFLRLLRKKMKKSLSSMALSPAAAAPPALSPSFATTPSPSPCSFPWTKVSTAAPPPAFASKPDHRQMAPQVLVSRTGEDTKLTGMIKRKRPAMLVIPEMRPGTVGCDQFGGWEALEECVAEVEGSGYCVVSKKGRRRVMEDSYGVITDVFGDPKQAFFGVFDGHGGRAAVDFVREKLGKNILSAGKDMESEEHGFEEAIKSGYMTTDREFLTQGVGSGACVATVLVEGGNLHAANVGDCRVVLSRNGVAIPLTRDHRVQRDDERARVQNLGGYVDYINGVWRVQGSLAISRAIGDLHMKEWVTSEPEIQKVSFSSDCEFLIMASDGLWDKVTNQEAVDEVMKARSRTESCRNLVQMSTCRGNKDDITIMIVDLHQFM